MSRTSLSILAYNTHLFGESLATKLISAAKKPLFYQDDRRAEIIATKINSSGADIVGLVEVWDDELARKIIKEVEVVYPHHFPERKETDFLTKVGDFVINLTQKRLAGNGLLLLSKHPLTDPAFSEYEDRNGDDAWSRKGILTAKADLPNLSEGGSPIKVRLFLTHTQAGETKVDKENREKNIRQLQGFIQPNGNFKRNDKDIPIFCIGDFNVIAECYGTGSPNEECKEPGQKTSEYQQIISILQEEEIEKEKVGLTDFYRELHSNFNESPGYTYLSEGENQPNKLITIFAKEDATNKVHQRLDYIFYSQKGSAIKVTPTEAKVLGGYTYLDGREDMNLSDHEPLWGKFNLEI
jgi:exonuclease III